MAATEFEPRMIVPRLESLESTLSEISYREAVKNASNFNARLTVDRKHRNPFIDSQTGIAHSPCSLYFNARQRLPGLKVGQIYSYPAKRWRKKRRQYLTATYNTVVPKKEDTSSADVNITTVETPTAVTSTNEDSKDSTVVVKDHESATSKDAWYYDEMEMAEMDCFDEPEPDSDYDYEETFSKRKKKRASAGGSRAKGNPAGGESPTNRRAPARGSPGVSLPSSNKVSNKKMSGGSGPGKRKTLSGRGSLY